MTQIQTGVTIEQVKDNNPGSLEEENEIKVINSIEDLVFFADDVRNGNTYENNTVKLGVNLDFELNKSYVNPNRTDYGNYGYEGNLKTALTTGEGFKTIGVNTNSSGYETKSFKGTFDGNGKVIRNLKIDNTLDNTTDDLRIGLFGNNYGTIKNIGIDNCNIKAKINENEYSVTVGGIAGVNYGTIELSYVSGCILGESNSILEGASTLVGGISGDCYGGKIFSCLTDCELYVKGNKVKTGGVSGATGGGQQVLIKNCFSKSLINLFEIENFNGFVNCGGVIGECDSGVPCELTSNFVVTKMIPNFSKAIGCYGGICGYGSNKGKISNCCVGDIEIDLPNVTGAGICGAVRNTLSSSDFSCTDCLYYSLTINRYCSSTGYDTNVKKVENKKDLPKIVDIVGEEFKELPSGSVVLKWQ